MIDVKYTLRNFEMEQVQKDLLKQKVERKFAKYKENMKFDVKLTAEKGRYLISVLGTFKNHTIETKEEGFDILKLADIAIKKVAAQITKVESKIANH